MQTVTCKWSGWCHIPYMYYHNWFCCILQEKANLFKWREKLDHVIANAQAQVRFVRSTCVCLSVCLSIVPYIGLLSNQPCKANVVKPSKRFKSFQEVHTPRCKPLHHYIHCESKKTPECFRHIFLQNEPDSDKVWYMFFWLNLP